MKTSEFIKVAHKHLVFRDDWDFIRSQYLSEEFERFGLSREWLCRQLDSFKDCLQKAGTFSQANLPILIVGPTGSGKRQVAKAIAEFANPKDWRVIPIDCRGIDEFSSIPVGPENLGPGKLLYIDHFNDASDDIQRKVAAILDSKSSGRPRIVLASDRDLDVKRTTLNLQRRGLIRVGTVRKDIAATLQNTTLKLSAIQSGRPWDIPPLVAYFLDGSHSIKYVTYNSLRFMLWYDWPLNTLDIKRMLTTPALYTESQAIFTFHDIEKYVSPEIHCLFKKDQALRVEFLEGDSRTPGRFLSIEWLTDEGMAEAKKLTGKPLKFDEAEEILFDVEKMRRHFMDILHVRRVKQTPVSEGVPSLISGQHGPDYPGFYQAIKDPSLAAEIRALLGNYIGLYRAKHPDDPYAQELKERTNPATRRMFVKQVLLNWNGLWTRSTVKKKFLYPKRITEWGTYLKRCDPRR